MATKAQIERDNVALTKEVTALKEVNEGLVAEVEAAEAKADAETLRAINAIAKVEALESAAEDSEETETVVAMEAVTVVNTRKNKLEICGLCFDSGEEVYLTGEQLRNEQLYNRIVRALDIGVLKEV